MSRERRQRNVEHLKRYLPTEVVDRMSQLLPLTDTRSLYRRKERLISLTRLSETVLRVLRFINYNLGDKESDGHYETCQYSANSARGGGGGRTCLCFRFRFALSDIQKYLAEHDADVEYACLNMSVRCEWGDRMYKTSGFPRTHSFVSSLLNSADTMKYTLQNVMSHPGYMSHVMSHTNKDIQRMRRILFIVDNCEAVKAKYIQHGLTDTLSSGAEAGGGSTKQGFQHFKECHWSNPKCTSGADTCICCNVGFHCYRIIRLLDKMLEEEAAAAAATAAADNNM